MAGKARGRRGQWCGKPPSPLTAAPRNLSCMIMLQQGTYAYLWQTLSTSERLPHVAMSNWSTQKAGCKQQTPPTTTVLQHILPASIEKQSPPWHHDWASNSPLQITSVDVLEEVLAKLKKLQALSPRMMAITASSPGIPISWNCSLEQVLHVLSFLGVEGFQLCILTFGVNCLSGTTN